MKKNFFFIEWKNYVSLGIYKKWQGTHTSYVQIIFMCHVLFDTKWWRKIIIYCVSLGIKLGKIFCFFSCLGLFLNQLMGKILREHNFHKNNFFLLSSVRDWKMRGWDLNQIILHHLVVRAGTTSFINFLYEICWEFFWGSCLCLVSL